ncbi:hypothetical protein AMECASPLE_029578 [Ameca splendens]|uniref:Uncharacterized protein n=1 Tax=Ameca splendens TaxID=208324 RepID=A0ABV0Z5A1_9TELE
MNLLYKTEQKYMCFYRNIPHTTKASKDHFRQYKWVRCDECIYSEGVCVFVDVCVVTVPCTLGPFSRSYRCYLTKPTQTLFSSFCFPSFVLFLGRQEAMEVPDQTGAGENLVRNSSCMERILQTVP